MSESGHCCLQQIHNRFVLEMVSTTVYVLHFIHDLLITSSMMYFFNIILIFFSLVSEFLKQCLLSTTYIVIIIYMYKYMYSYRLYYRCIINDFLDMLKWMFQEFKQFWDTCLLYVYLLTLSMFSGNYVRFKFALMLS